MESNELKKFKRTMGLTYELNEFFASLNVENDDHFDFDMIACYLAINMHGGYLTEQMIDHFPNLIRKAHKAIQFVEEKGINSDE